ncbi:MAG: glycosyltransferase family 4 protein [Oscillospiraceae bacterium]|nr:glycosyltransferase family 4 protein [Oscillospiraceae bacterium]
MKILITSDWYAPAVNGVVASVLNLRRELQARGHEVRVLTLSQTPHSFEQDGVTSLGSIPAGLIYPGARLRTAPAERMVKDLVRWHPDVVHSQCEFSTFILAQRIAKAADAPLVHTYHTVYENYTHYFSPSVRLGRHAVAKFSRWVGAHTDCMIAPTEKVAGLLRGYRVKCPVYVVPTGIDLARFQVPVDPQEVAALRSSLGIPPENLVLASVGRLAAEKNISELLINMTTLRDRPITLLLVGDGPYRNELELQVKRLGIEKQVVFAGMVSPARVPVYYRLGDVFVCASTSETQGLTYIEALGCGLPALCRADACLDGVITDGVDGWQYHDCEAFDRHLNELLAQPALRSQMSKAALVTANTFSAVEFARKAEAVYETRLRADHGI